MYTELKFYEVNIDSTQLGMRGIKKCPTIIYRLKNTVIRVYRGI